MEPGLLLITRGEFSMPAMTTSSGSALRRVLKFHQVISAGIIMLGMVASARGQAPTPKPNPNAKRTHWREYVNRGYGFSFWYPDPYKPEPPPTSDDYNFFNRYRLFVRQGLLLLQRRDNPDAKIWISIDVRPSNLHTLTEEHAPRGWEPATSPVLAPKGHPIGRPCILFLRWRRWPP